ncbi:MAG: GNAT family N-acetyltransferase [Candidatus Bathyarchaeia archaeon]
MVVDLNFRPLTSETWQDLQTLFEEDRVCRACWCMWWRISASDWMRQRGKDNREAMEAIVKSGKVAGILAYSDDKPIGWCSISPREEYCRLERSRTLRRIDDKLVWSVVCFFVGKPFRGHGVATRLLEAAVAYAGKQGAKIVEGYPSRSNEKQSDRFVYTGLMSSFEKVGFLEVQNSSKSKAIMRYVFEGK